MLDKTISSSPHVVAIKIRFNIIPPPQFHVRTGLTILQNLARWIAQ